MRTGLDHLPDQKRRDLEKVVEILFAEFEDALKGRGSTTRKQGRILKVVLAPDSLPTFAMSARPSPICAHGAKSSVQGGGSPSLMGRDPEAIEHPETMNSGLSGAGGKARPWLLAANAARAWRRVSGHRAM